MTGLYDPQAEALVRKSFLSIWSVAFTSAAGNPIPLDVIAAEVTFDEFWSPHAQATITAVVPTDQSVLDALDPRTRVKVTIKAGYVLADGVKDLQPIAELYLVDRQVNRPSNEIRISAQGKEYLYDTWEPLWAGEGWIVDLRVPVWRATTAARDAVTWALTACRAISDQSGVTPTDPTWDYDGALQATGWADSGDPWAPELEPPIAVCRDIADRVNGWFRCDETGVWRLTARPVLAGNPAHHLYVGANGTVIGSDTGLSRLNWFNTVQTRYAWKDSAGNDQESTGYAYITSGPYAEQNTGRVLRRLDFPWKGGPVHAQNRAMSVLRRHLSKGRTMALDAVAAFWLRAGQTITVQLPLGPLEHHLVSAVTFDLNQGSMRVTTRVPDTTTAIGGG